MALAACEAPSPPPGGTRAARSADEVASHEADEAARTHVVMINGGGRAGINYQSHLLHLRELHELFLDRRIPPERTTIFASDGEDPGLDLAVLDPPGSGEFWLIDGLPVAAALRPEIRLEDTRIAGVRVRPATKEELRSWFAAPPSQPRAGDTVIVYVTDHGWKNEADLTNNAVVLWGERLTVRELAALVDLLPAGVRVVMLMSQCFSGSFAHLGEHTDTDACGYFSSSPERFAYGCYPENRGKKNVGHSFRWIEALRGFGNFPDAHRRVILADRTPDVPGRTSDYYLEGLLEREAGLHGIPFRELVDELLAQSWKDEAHYGEDWALVDRVGEVYGSFAPRTLRDLDERSANLPDLSRDLAGYAKRWKRALLALQRENFDRFLEAHPHWADFVAPDLLGSLDDAARSRTLDWLLADLGAFTESHGDVRRRLKLLRTMAREAHAARYRMEVRLGVALRMRLLLVRIAGLVHLDRHGDDAQRERFERLVACEGFAFADRRTSPLARARMPENYPPLADEMELLGTLLPGWLGVEYRSIGAARRGELGAGAGAAEVTRVYPGSPADLAGIDTGDVILGPPGRLFDERHALREWALTSLIDEVRSLDVVRDGVLRTLDLRVAPPPS